MGNTHDTEIARIEADCIQTKWRTTEDYRWGYVGDRGPDTWWVHYPSASGAKQSPVDILTEETAVDINYGSVPLQICYHTPTHMNHSSESLESPGETKILVNTGSTARVNVVNSRSYVTGGPCKSYTYVLEQFHVHWGEADSAGSEHYVNGYPFSAEIHLVHWNEDLYSSYEDAAVGDEGILVIAVFVKSVANEGEGGISSNLTECLKLQKIKQTSWTVKRFPIDSRSKASLLRGRADSKSNKTLNQLSAMLDDVVYREQNVPIPEEFSINDLIPDDLSKYWTYRGSFSTPPCYETVTWIVLETPTYISSKALGLFRELRCYAENEERPDDEYDGELRSNRRPVQPIGTRKITYVDCDLFRHSHELGVGDHQQRPFRNGGGRGGCPGSSVGVRLAAFQDYVSRYSRDGIYGGSRGG